MRKSLMLLENCSCAVRSIRSEARRLSRIYLVTVAYEDSLSTIPQTTAFEARRSCNWRKYTRIKLLSAPVRCCSFFGSKSAKPFLEKFGNPATPYTETGLTKEPCMNRYPG